jgi:hypothetical protein
MTPKLPAARASRDKYAFFEDLGLHIPSPERAHPFVEKTVQGDAIYDLSKYALEGGPEDVNAPFNAAGQRHLIFNSRLIDITQQNVNAAFELVRSLAGCRNFVEIAEVQMAFWSKQMTVLVRAAG